MSYYSKLKSHPNKNLEEHLCNVASISKNIFNDLSIKDNDLYANLSFFILSYILLIVFYHLNNIA